jgi:hypothetical protein
MKPETFAIFLLGVTDVILLFLAFSYTLAYKVKKTYSVLSFAIYFWVSTLIYLSFFIQYINKTLTHSFFFLDCECFFIILASIRVFSAFFVLWATFRNYNKI